MDFSFIIPVYHGELTIEKLFEKIKACCDMHQYTYEVVFVWDCGPDRSWEIIEKLKSNHPDHVQGIKLSRNFGQHNAIICGFSVAKGQWMVTMDEDLQHDPMELPLLVDKQKTKDYDLVYGHYPNRQHNAFRNITSWTLKKMLEKGIPDLHRDYSAYRLIKRETALSTLEMQNSYTFIDGYFSWITTHVGSIEISHNSRQGGISSYTLKKLISHSINIFVTFSDLPIKIVNLLSLLFFAITTTYAFYILISKIIFNNLVPGFASTIVMLGFGIGSILFGISVLGEYIHRINLKTTKRPNYRISSIL